MALTLDVLTEFKKINKIVSPTLSKDEVIYFNYLFFYLIHDRIRCSYHEAKDALLVVNLNQEPLSIVRVSDLKILPYTEAEGFYRRDAIFRRMEKIPITKGTKLKVLSLLEQYAGILSGNSRTKVKRMFINHKRNINK